MIIDPLDGHQGLSRLRRGVAERGDHVRARRCMADEQ